MRTPMAWCHIWHEQSDGQGRRRSGLHNRPPCPTVEHQCHKELQGLTTCSALESGSKSYVGFWLVHTASVCASRQELVGPCSTNQTRGLERPEARVRHRALPNGRTLGGPQANSPCTKPMQAALTSEAWKPRVCVSATKSLRLKPSSGSARPMDVGPSLANIGATSVELARVWLNSIYFATKSGPNLADAVRGRSNSELSSANIGHNRS